MKTCELWIKIIWMCILLILLLNIQKCNYKLKNQFLTYLYFKSIQNYKLIHIDI